MPHENVSAERESKIIFLDPEGRVRSLRGIVRFRDGAFVRIDRRDGTLLLPIARVLYPSISEREIGLSMDRPRIADGLLEPRSLWKPFCSRIRTVGLPSRLPAPPQRQTPLDRRERLGPDLVHRTSCVDDRESPGFRETIVVSRDFPKQAQILEPDLIRAVLDAAKGDKGGNPEEYRQVRLKDPLVARALEKPNRILEKLREPGPLIGVRRVRISVAQDQFTASKVAPDLRNVSGPIRQEQERLGEGARVPLDPTPYDVTEPSRRRLARQKDWMPKRS